MARFVLWFLILSLKPGYSNEKRKGRLENNSIERAMRRADQYDVPPFPALRAFHAVVRHGRLKSAAAELGITESAVSHQIRRLEDYLQQSLFHRRPEGLVLTSEGERYHAAIDPALHQIATATRALMGVAEGGRVSLTLPPSLAMLWLIPRLGAFEDACPDIALNLVTSARVVDLRRERVDLAIRNGKGKWPGVESEFLMHELAMPVCHPSLLEGRDDWSPQDALVECRLITSDHYANEWEEWAHARGLETPDLSTALRLEAQEQVIEAAGQGLGLAMGRSPVIDGRLADGSLVAPFGMASRSATSFFLCHARDADLTSSAKRVAAWLKTIADAVQSRPRG